MEKKEKHVLDDEIAAFDRMRESLMSHHKDKWVVIRGGELKGAYDTFHNAATFAVEQFGRGPYLIRQVGAPEEFMILPRLVPARPL